MDRYSVFTLVVIVISVSCSDTVFETSIKSTRRGRGWADVEYFNQPWHYKVPGELIDQPKCVLDLGTDPIEAGKLQLSLVFENPVDTIIQWSFNEVAPYTYTNKAKLYPYGNMEFQFQVVYNGTVYKSKYTKPPTGYCLYNLEYTEETSYKNTKGVKGYADVEYINKPWHYKVDGELIEQPRCILDFGLDPIEAGDLELTLVFERPIDGIIQWTYKEVDKYSYTNPDTIYPYPNMEFQFQVIYDGKMDASKYTKPPPGYCLFATSKLVYLFLAPIPESIKEAVVDKKCGDGCAEIEYLNKPFKYPKAEGELIAQPRCLMDLGKDPIQPNKLQVSLAFNSVVDQIIQWTFTEVKPLTYTFPDAYYPSAPMEWQFQVVYNGSFTTQFTDPPKGYCLYKTA